MQQNGKQSASEFHLKHRPVSFKAMVGQTRACKMLHRMLKEDRLPHALMLSGPSGCGKTTLARILKVKLGCDRELTDNKTNVDFQEVNAADDRGIDTIREIRSRIRLSPACGDCRIWLIDECHCLTSDAQSGFLKILEEVPPYAYFFLATTDPDKMKQTIRTRVTEIKLDPLSPDDIQALLTQIATKESISVSEELIQKIIDVSHGSAREAVKLLNAVAQLPEDFDRIKAIEDPVEKKQAFDLVRLLIYVKPDWKKAAETIKALAITDHERFRHFVLTCANTELLKGGTNSERAWCVIEAFRQPFFAYPQAGIAHACFEILSRK